MRTKEQLVKDIGDIDLRYCSSEPVVSASKYLHKDGVYKCCVYFNLYNMHYEKERIRLTINLKSLKEKQADKEMFELLQQCQDAIHFSFISLSKHNFITSIEKWVDALGATNRVELTTLTTMKEKIKVIKRYKAFETISVEDFSQTDINKFNQWALDNGSKSGGSLARETVKGVHTFISMFFNFAYSQGIVNINPCNGVKVPTKAVDDNNYNKKQWLDEKEYKALRNWLKEQVEAGQTKWTKLIDIIDIEVYTGMRREELFGLKWDCIDFEEGLLHTGGARVRAGSRDIYKNTLKSKSSHRTYSLTDKIIDIFVGIKNRQVIKGIYAPNNFIFIYEDEKENLFGKPYCLDTITKLFKKAIINCDEIHDKSIHFHSLRHTCVTLMMQMNYSKHEVQAWIGHEEGSSITDRVYNHYKYVMHKDKIERLSSLIGD